MSNQFDLSKTFELREAFFAKLQQKTGWGRNEIRTLFDDCAIKILSEAISDYEIDESDLEVPF